MVGGVGAGAVPARTHLDARGSYALQRCMPWSLQAPAACAHAECMCACACVCVCMCVCICVRACSVVGATPQLWCSDVCPEAGACLRCLWR